MSDSIYPPGPTVVHERLTALTPSYRLRATLAVLSVFLFFLLYLGMVIGLGFLVHEAVFYPIENINKVTIFLKVGAIAASVMLFVFTLKFIFKLRNHKAENRIKLKQKDFPVLWSFVDRICEDTGAPKPKAIYADPDVNAYVSYSNMWLSLFFPVRKELTLGMGLVTCLNLSEFKAVVAHEFGHFAQSSMTIGSYIHSANTIIHDMIFSRDKWDHILEQWRGQDLRLSAAAWVITPLIWLIRQMLSLFYRFLNVMHSSLSREMEFNADKTAVSTTGSEAIVSALWRLDSGSAIWNETINHAYLAEQKSMVVKNLYQHHVKAIEKNQGKLNVEYEAMSADDRGGKLFFTSSENSAVSMYASHPPNDQRESSAKSPYIPCETDARPAWLLFEGQHGIQEELTALLYKQYLNKEVSANCSTEEFDRFVSAELHGKELLEAYDNTFRDRFLNVPSEKELQGAPLMSADKLKEELKQLMTPVREIEALMTKASQISEGSIKDKSFAFDGATYDKKKLNDGYQALLSRREELFNTGFKEWDASFCGHFYQLAKSKQSEGELLKLYTQHDALSGFYRYLVAVKNKMFTELNRLQNQEGVTESMVNDFGDRVNLWLGGVNAELKKLGEINFVPLPNIANQEELLHAIVVGGEFKQEHGPMFENGGFDRIANQVESAMMHCQRIDQKSIATILEYHHSLEE